MLMFKKKNASEMHSQLLIIDTPILHRKQACRFEKKTQLTIISAFTTNGNATC